VLSLYTLNLANISARVCCSILHQRTAIQRTAREDQLKIVGMSSVCFDATGMARNPLHFGPSFVDDDEAVLVDISELWHCIFPFLFSYHDPRQTCSVNGLDAGWTTEWRSTSKDCEVAVSHWHMRTAQASVAQGVSDSCYVNLRGLAEDLKTKATADHRDGSRCTISEPQSCNRRDRRARCPQLYSSGRR
jgi:hypothetical protein